MSQDKRRSDSRLRMDDSGSCLEDTTRHKASLKHMNTCPEFMDMKPPTQLTQSLVKLKPKRAPQRLTLEHEAKAPTPRLMSQARTPRALESTGRDDGWPVKDPREQPGCHFDKHIKSIPTLVSGPAHQSRPIPKQGKTGPQFSRQMAKKVQELQPFQKPLVQNQTNTVKPALVKKNTSTFEYSYGTKKEMETKKREISHKVQVITRGVKRNFNEVMSKNSGNGVSKSPQIYRPRGERTPGIKPNWRVSGQSQTMVNLHRASRRPQGLRESTLKRNYSTEHALGKPAKQIPVIVDLNPYEYYDIVRSPRAKAQRPVPNKLLDRRTSRNQRGAKSRAQTSRRDQSEKRVSRRDLEQRKRVYRAKQTSEYYN